MAANGPKRTRERVSSMSRRGADSTFEPKLGPLLTDLGHRPHERRDDIAQGI
jgi:hypothetical protein